MSFQESIIVVDDDQSMAHAIERLLRAAGWVTQSFSSAEALMDCPDPASAGGYVLDVRLPGASGLELCAELLRRGAQGPIVFVTAHGNPADHAEADLKGSAGYFTKPFRGADLIEALSRHLQPT